MTQPSICIDDATDPNLGFLSYRNQDPFEVDNLIWPSVERYVLARHFAGTPLEEKIRLFGNTKTVLRMTKPLKKTEVLPSGLVTLKIYYKYGLPSQINTEAFIAKAIESKFKKTEERLLKTFPFKFVSKSNPEYAELLTRFRDHLYQSKMKEGKAYLDLVSDLRDLHIWDRLIEIMERYVSKLKKIDHVKKDHPGIYEDALWNMAPKGKAQKIVENLSPETIIKKMPNQQEVVSRSYTYLGRRFPDKINHPEFLKLAATMWATFRWQILHHQKTGAEYHWHLKKKNLSMKPTPRPYRNSKIKAPHLRSLEVRTKEYIELFGGTEEYDSMVKKYEKMKPLVRDRKIDALMEAKKRPPPKEPLPVPVAKGVEEPLQNHPSPPAPSVPTIQENYSDDSYSVLDSEALDEGEEAELSESLGSSDDFDDGPED